MSIKAPHWPPACAAGAMQAGIRGAAVRASPLVREPLGGFLPPLSERTDSNNGKAPGSTADCQNGTELFQWFGSGSNPAAPTMYSRREQATGHDGTHLQARADRDAVRRGQDQGMGARVRAGTAASNRAADGLDKLGRHASAGAAALRESRGSDRVLRAPRHCLPTLQNQAGGAARHLLRRQFRRQPARSLDALIAGGSDHRLLITDFWTTRLAPHSAMLASAAISAR